jgi:hypothetical protein
MAKNGLHFHKFAHQLKGFVAKEGWVLCVGAGTSLPLFPSWNELVKRLIQSENPHRNAAANEVLQEQLTNIFQPDALIEAARDRLGLSPEEFAVRLGEELYKDIVSEFGSSWGQAARVMSAASPGDLMKRQWVEFLEKIRAYNKKLAIAKQPELSAISLAEAVMDSVNLLRAPTAIISFNADPLLYALINAIAAERHVPKNPADIRRSRVIDRVTRVISYREVGRIPYFSCHGLLSFPKASIRFNKEIDFGKLVFSEGEYLALANSSFSWQSSAFLSSSVFRHMIFVGVSLSDSNMRRWLAWVHATRKRELAAFGADVASTSHYWLNKRPKSDDEARWIESCVAHLGVRLIWLDEALD